MSSVTRVWHPVTQSYQSGAPENQLRNEEDTELCMGETNVIAATIVQLFRKRSCRCQVTEALSSAGTLLNGV